MGAKVNNLKTERCILTIALTLDDVKCIPYKISDTRENSCCCSENSGWLWSFFAFCLYNFKMYKIWARWLTKIHKHKHYTNSLQKPCLYDTCTYKIEGAHLKVELAQFVCSVFSEIVFSIIVRNTNFASAAADRFASNILLNFTYRYVLTL